MTPGATLAGMPNESPGNMSAVLRPVGRMREPLRVLHGAGATIPASVAFDDAEAVEGLSRLLEQAQGEATRPDGTIDHHLQAAHVLRAMRTR